MNRACPGCGNTSPHDLGEKNSFLMMRCTSCGSLYSASMPGLEKVENYDEYYDESNLSVPEFIYARIAEIVGDFARFRKNGRLLDVGFGAGSLMNVAREQGWEVSGVEVSEPAVRQARQQGFDVFHGDLRLAGYPDEHFDVVTASEILEHCDEPEKLLQEVARILRPGGLFWATTPAASGLSYRVLGLKWSILTPPEHLQLFSKGAVMRMLAKSGFSRAKVKTYGFGVSEVLTNLRGSSEGYNRVTADYSLNEALTRSPARTAVKSALNETLNLFGLGDSLKIYAVH